MATFKLPATELLKLRKYKRKLLEQQRKLDRAEFDKLAKADQDISIHKAIEKSSQISQVLETLEPKGEQIATSFKGAVTTAGGRELPLTEPVYEKAEPTRQSFLDAFKLASEYGLPTPKKLPKPLGDKELKSRNFLDEWDIDYDENLTADANITNAIKQVYPHQQAEFIAKSEALFAKPKAVKPLTMTDRRERIELRKHIRDFDKQNNLSLINEWNPEDDILDNLNRITDAIPDEDMRLEFIRGAERIEEKKPTEKQALTRITTLEKAKMQLETTGGLSAEIFEAIKGVRPEFTKALQKADKTEALEAIERELEYLKPFIGEDETKEITLPTETKTTSQAVNYLMDNGMDRDAAIEWLRRQ